MDITFVNWFTINWSLKGKTKSLNGPGKMILTIWWEIVIPIVMTTLLSQPIQTTVSESHQINSHKQSKSRKQIIIFGSQQCKAKQSNWIELNWMQVQIKMH